MSAEESYIHLEGVRVNNLQNVSVRIPWHQLTVICGLSGSGKSSLAFDTLFAEGQRRYVETFSPYTRQFLDSMERPEADRIEGIPPAIAIRQNAWAQQAAGTVGSRTEIYDLLRTLFTRYGTQHCPNCGRKVRPWSPQSVADYMAATDTAERAMVVFSIRETTDVLLSRGYARVLQAGPNGLTMIPVEEMREDAQTLVVADRLTLSPESCSRITEAVSNAFFDGGEQCRILTANPRPDTGKITIDGTTWHESKFARQPRCHECDCSIATLNEGLLNFRSSGRCATCHGEGTVASFDLDFVADSTRTIAGGGIGVWQSGPGLKQQKLLLEMAAKLDIRTDTPVSELSARERRILQRGTEDSKFDGLNGLHRKCTNSSADAAIRLLKDWQSAAKCPSCAGSRLNRDALAVHLGGVSIAEVLELPISQLCEWLRVVSSGCALLAESTTHRRLSDRVTYLESCGVGYLSAARRLNTLSGGERQRVALTSALGSGLINTLFVLDEPTAGLHPSDAERIVSAARQLRDSGNTVVVVEHHPAFIDAADQIVETGPAAGREGGQIVFAGSPGQLEHADTPTAEILRRPTPAAVTEQDRRREVNSWIRFEAASCHNIDNLSGSVPTGVICAVTGVSGSGKSSLFVETLYPALCRHLGIVIPESAGSVFLTHVPEDIAHVQLLTQAVMRGNRRSIPATVIQCFNEIRRVFAQTREAKKRNFGTGLFSFNSSSGGRCEHCDGRGVLQIEMQFLPDIEATCDVCGGSRYRKDVLEVEYRNRNIHDVLQMTADDAFVFFKGTRRVQARLNALRLAGLGYLTLGQPVSTLSGGESQRLRLAAVLAGAPSEDELPRRQEARTTGGSLFLLDEPSTGLHGCNVDRLVECLKHLVESGHSVVAIDHNPHLIAAADHVIEMGPGAGTSGGQIVAGAHE